MRYEKHTTLNDIIEDIRTNNSELFNKLYWNAHGFLYKNDLYSRIIFKRDKNSVFEVEKQTINYFILNNINMIYVLDNSLPIIDDNKFRFKYIF